MKVNQTTAVKNEGSYQDGYIIGVLEKKARFAS